MAERRWKTKLTIRKKTRMRWMMVRTKKKSRERMVAREVER
jgi:hypothetical protein